MNKTDLVNYVVEQTGMMKKDCEKLVVAFTESISDTLAEGEKVKIAGFGTFEVRERAERDGQNPLTGETIKIAAGKIPAFKAGKALKGKLN